MKTIAELNEKWWFRAIEIIYFIGVAINYIFLVTLFFLAMPFDFAMGFTTASTVVQLLVFGYFWPGVFYYIVLGKFNPPLK